MTQVSRHERNKSLGRRQKQVGELGPFVKKGWREDPVAASGAALNSVFKKYEKPLSGKQTELLI